MSVSVLQSRGYLRRMLLRATPKPGLGIVACIATFALLGEGFSFAERSAQACSRWDQEGWSYSACRYIASQQRGKSWGAVTAWHEGGHAFCEGNLGQTIEGVTCPSSQDDEEAIEDIVDLCRFGNEDDSEDRLALVARFAALDFAGSRPPGRRQELRRSALATDTAEVIRVAIRAAISSPRMDLPPEVRIQLNGRGLLAASGGVTVSQSVVESVGDGLRLPVRHLVPEDYDCAEGRTGYRYCRIPGADVQIRPWVRTLEADSAQVYVSYHKNMDGDAGQRARLGTLVLDLARTDGGWVVTRIRQIVT